MDKEKHRRKQMTVFLPSPFQVQKEATQKQVHLTLSFMHKTQRPFLMRRLFFIFFSGKDNMSVWIADHSMVIFPSSEVEIKVGVVGWRHLCSCPTVSESHHRRGKKNNNKKRSSTAMMTPWRCDLALISRPQSETRFTFCPLWSFWLAQKDQEMVEEDRVFEGECVLGSGWWGLSIPPSPSWDCTTSHTPEVKVGPQAH